MQVLVLYGSSRRSTQMVVNRLPQYLKFPFDVINVKSQVNLTDLKPYELLLFFVPTYGDGEVQEDMERFMLRLSSPLPTKQFCICELGNYYGYDDFAHGAMPILREHLTRLGAKEFAPPVSIDSLPKKDWQNLNRWCSLLNERLEMQQSE